MDDARWRDVKRIFQAAITVQPSEREALIEDDCAGDDALASEIRSLLSAHERGLLFLETPAAELQPSWFAAACDSLERTGAWKILRNIGHGGMADVYLAERADGHFQKQVAVKVLRAGLFGEDVRACFSREQQVLADLDHPNIVRLLDGGITT